MINRKNENLKDFILSCFLKLLGIMFLIPLAFYTLKWILPILMSIVLTPFELIYDLIYFLAVPSYFWLFFIVGNLLLIVLFPNNILFNGLKLYKPEFRKKFIYINSFIYALNVYVFVSVITIIIKVPNNEELFSPLTDNFNFFVFYVVLQVCFLLSFMSSDEHYSKEIQNQKEIERKKR